MVAGSRDVFVGELREQHAWQLDVVSHIVKRSGEPMSQARQFLVFFREIANQPLGCRISLQEPAQQHFLTGMMTAR
jgi:hypothetical protein